MCFRAIDEQEIGIDDGRICIHPLQAASSETQGAQSGAFEPDVRIESTLTHLYRKANIRVDQVQQACYAVASESQPVPMNLLDGIGVRAEPLEYLSPDAKGACRCGFLPIFYGLKNRGFSFTEIKKSQICKLHQGNLIHGRMIPFPREAELMPIACLRTLRQIAGALSVSGNFDDH
jgi:hypothetical protein